MKIAKERLLKPLPRFLVAVDMGRTFVIHTEVPRFIADMVFDVKSPNEAAVCYRPIDDVEAWAKAQPGGVFAAMQQLHHDVGEFYVAYLDRKQAISQS